MGWAGRLQIENLSERTCLVKWLLRSSKGMLEKNSVIDVREVGIDLNWLKQLKVTFIALLVLS
jgi:hypothetical protein